MLKKRGRCRNIIYALISGPYPSPSHKRHQGFTFARHMSLTQRLVAPLKFTYELENFFSICKMERFISILFLLSYHKISFSWLRRLAFSTLIYTIDVRNSTTDTFQSNWRILKINKSANLMILVHCYGTHLPILYVKKPINEVVSSSLSRKL